MCLTLFALLVLDVLTSFYVVHRSLNCFYCLLLARAYGSSCSLVITLLQPKIAKKSLKINVIGFKVIQGH